MNNPFLILFLCDLCVLGALLFLRQCHIRRMNRPSPFRLFAIRNLFLN